MSKIGINALKVCNLKTACAQKKFFADAEVRYIAYIYNSHEKIY